MCATLSLPFQEEAHKGYVFTLHNKAEEYKLFRAQELSSGQKERLLHWGRVCCITMELLLTFAFLIWLFLRVHKQGACVGAPGIREHAFRRIRRNLGRGRRGHHAEEAFFIVFLLLKAHLRGAPRTLSSLGNGISSIAYDNFK